MTYLLNAWYCAAWAGDIGERPVAITLLDEKVVLYRDSQGKIVALGDVCPHRFALLHAGKIKGDALECPYHGLRFGPDGTCVLNPHGDVIPPTLKVRAFPTLEQDAIAWIWMGDAALADPASIPRYPAHSDPHFVTVSGVLRIAGGYQLVTDNLLDLSHTQFLHPILTLPDDPDTVIEHDILQDGDRLTTVYNQRNARPFGFVKLVWPEAPDRIDAYSGVRWDAPANMLLKVHFVARDGSPPQQRMMWGAELITPETETTCHYFWSSARDFRLDDAAFSAVMHDAIESVFRNEDGVMIATVQQNMAAETDLLAMRPVVLPTDQAAIRARMLLKRKLRADRGSADQPASDNAAEEHRRADRVF